MSVLAAAHRGVAGYPVLAFMLISLGLGFVTATIPPIADSERSRRSASPCTLLLQLVFFQLAEEIGFTGFLQHHWQDRYSPMKLTLYVALLWAVWHMPDHFAEEGWGLEQLISAPVVFAIDEFVSLFFARALFVWSYNRTGSSVLLVVPSDRLVSHVTPVLAPNQEAGRNLHARHATQWAQDWFSELGRHQLRGTIGYPKAA
jgi:membrane protease YdiL (CAAX protease family)